jgi:hypothetical protein
MSVNRIVSLAAAVVISAIQVTALSRPLSHVQSVRAAAAAVSIADDASDGALPVVVVTAQRSESRLSGPLSMRCKGGEAATIRRLTAADALEHR